MATKNVQLKNGGGDLLMPKTNAGNVTYDATTTLISSSSLQEAGDSVLNGAIEIDLSTPNGNGLIHPQTRKWYIDSNPRTHFVFKVMNANKISVTANNSVKSYVYFLKTYTTPVHNNGADMTSSPMDILSIDEGTSYTHTIPSDCNYIVIMARNGSSTNMTPSKVTLINDNPKPLNNGIFDIDFSHSPSALNWVDPTGNPQERANNTHQCFRLDGIKKIQITGGVNNSYYTFATSVDTTGWTPLAQVRYMVAAGVTDEIDVPSMANYIITGKLNGPISSLIDYSPATAVMYNAEGVEDAVIVQTVQNIDKNVDFTKQEILFGWINGDAHPDYSGTFYENGTLCAHYSLPIFGESVTIVANSNNSYITWAERIDGYQWKRIDGVGRITINGTQTLNVPNTAKYLIVGKSPANGSDYTPQSIVFHKSARSALEDVSLVEIPQNQYKAFSWKLMTYNIGHLNGGGPSTESSISDSNYDDKKTRLNYITKQFAPNFIGLVEYTPLFAPNTTAHSTETTRDAVFSDSWDSFVGLRYDTGSAQDYDAVMARVPISDCEMKSWTDPRLTRKYLKGKWNFLGIPVTTIIVHFQFDQDKTDPTLQNLQVAELIAECANEPHVIIMGDLNIPSLSVLDPFVAAGYSLSNGGAFGEFNTYRFNDAFATRCLDNIIVKGFNIENVYMLDTDLSDHNPLISDIRIIV